VALARDAQAAGDRIAAENYIPHAEHDFRLINESGGDQPPRQQPNAGAQGGQHGQGGGQPGQGGDQQGGAQVQAGHGAAGAATAGGASVTPTGYAAMSVQDAPASDPQNQ
ncbi:MAG: DUF4167 domain-containing protein, partial [Rhodospirillales bacterium]